MRNDGNDDGDDDGDTFFSTSPTMTNTKLTQSTSWIVTQVIDQGI
jgi:hypothetical protein